MTELQKAKEEYDHVHQVWFNTSIYAEKEIKNKVDSDLKKARAKYDEAYRAQFPNHEIINF